MNAYHEACLTFACGDHPLLGVIAAPPQPAEIGVLVVVGGPQYRAGSHRQFVLLCRALAEAGFAAMRFDARGMGDSEGEHPGFLHRTPDIAAAIQAFQNHCPVQKIVLWGLCDAASAALLYWGATRDARLAGLVLLNPWVRSEATLARTQIKHYYGRRLLEADFWKKLLRGKVGLGRALGGLIGNLRRARSSPPALSTPGETPYQNLMAEAWESFPGARLLVLSGEDYTAAEFLETLKSNPAWARVWQQPCQREDLAAADHTFSTAAWRDQVASWTVEWLKGGCTGRGER